MSNEQWEESKSRVNYNYVINGSIHISKYLKVSNKWTLGTIKQQTKTHIKMEKLNREEILCLIRKMGGVEVKLENTSIHAVVTYQKYINFLIELSIDDLKYIAGNYIRSVAKVFDYTGVIEYDFAFDSIIIAAKATILKK